MHLWDACRLIGCEPQSDLCFEVFFRVNSTLRSPKDVAIEPQATKPPIREMVVLFAQPPLGTNAEAVADNEHPDHQFRINRRATRLAE